MRVARFDNSAIQLFLRDAPDDVAHVAEALKLSHEEVAQIIRLVTENARTPRHTSSTASGGRGGITIRLGSHAYWLATSDPLVDGPWREAALTGAGTAGDASQQERSHATFRALDLLANPEWHLT